jgi:hypothetical protein
MALRLLRLAPLLVFALLPAIGILFLGWDWREVLVLYWFENVGLGVAIVVRMLRPAFVDAREGGNTTRGRSLINFCLYYGLFTLVHGVFVFAIVGGAIDGILGGSGATPQPSTASSLDWPSILVVTLVGTALHIAAALLGPAPIRLGDRLIATAYQRVNVLHVAILAGAILIVFLGLPSAAALVLVVLHAIVDVVTWRATGAAARRPQQYEPRHLNQDEPDPEF